MKRMLALVGLSVALSIAMTVLVATIAKFGPRLMARDEEGEEAIEP
jgi:hypothetical protein